MGVTGYTRMKKYDLVMRLLRAETEAQGLIFGGGTLEVIPGRQSGSCVPTSR